MFYEPAKRNHGLRHDPFKALAVPRPIGWVGTLNEDGSANLAPYSFFNAIADRPPMVMFSSGGLKDSLRNVRRHGEFTCSLANWPLREAMNLSSAPVKAGVDEFDLAGLAKAPSRIVKPPHVAAAPAAFECGVWQIIELPSDPGGRVEPYTLVIGEVLAIHIDDQYIADGMVNTAAMQPIARMGYMDYSVVRPDNTFTLNRPLASEDGRGVEMPKDWDGVYR